MVWTIDRNPDNVFEYCGQTVVRVRSSQGEIGLVRMSYEMNASSLSLRATSPVFVFEDVELDAAGLPLREARILDKWPTFRGAHFGPEMGGAARLP